jgi:glycosyltransferase involved in cell wall biosynthesis
MRVALVSEHASPLAALGGVDAGGQNVHVAALAAELGRSGVSVVVHTRRDSPAPPDLVPLAPRVVVHHVDAGPPHAVPKDELLPHMARFAEVLRRRWRVQRPDIVHAHFWMSGVAALEAAAVLDIPVVQTFHALGTVKRRYQGDADTSPPERLAVERRLAREADMVVVTCKDEARELLAMGADPARLRVVPCGVDLSLFSPKGPVARRRPGLARLLVVGRLVERKGTAEVIAALRALPEVELLIAGGPTRAAVMDDPEAQRLRTLAESMGVADRVHFCGMVPRTELAPLFRSADLVICTPWYEPFGIVPLEAMACGVPVVAAAVGGLCDTVVDGLTGVHVPPRRPDVLASIVSNLLADEPRRRAMGAAGVRRVRRLYTWERVGKATLIAYRRLMPIAGRSAVG